MNKVMNALMEKFGLSEADLRADGRATLSVDGKYRVHLIPSNNGVLAVESKIRTLPDDAKQMESLLANAMHNAVARMRESACTLALDRDNQNLLLQCRIKADATPIEALQVLESFLNEIALWRAIA